MVVDLARPFLVGTGEIGEPGILHPSEGGVEFLVVDQEGVMLGAHILGIDEVERDAIAGLDWPERPPLRSDIHAQDVSQEFCRGILVLGRNDDVVEGWHRELRWLSSEVGVPGREFNRLGTLPRPQDAAASGSTRRFIGCQTLRGMGRRVARNCSAQLAQVKASAWRRQAAGSPCTAARQAVRRSSSTAPTPGAVTTSSGPGTG